ncbi:MAG: transporter [Pyrobaculum sp.]
MIDITLAVLSALAYGIAPIIYRPALSCMSQYRAISLFSLYSIALGLALPWRDIRLEGVIYAAAAGLLGGIIGTWLYLTSIKTAGAAIGNIASSLYIVLLPLSAGKLYLAPSALLVLLGIAIVASSRGGPKFGLFHGVGAAAVWTWSIQLYATAVEMLGPGGASFYRGLFVSLAAAAIAGRGGVCKTTRVVVGGFLDTFVGFGAFTLAVSIGDYVVVSIFTSTYPLITALLERPTSLRKVVGAAAAVAGLATASIK